jgi:hypothetical protein
MNLIDTYTTNTRLVDILQLISLDEKVRVRDIDDIEPPTVVTGTPKEIASKKEEWLRCEVLSVTREFSETELMQIDVIED